MARRIPKDKATPGQIQAAAKSAINEKGHLLSADQRQTLLTGHREAQADVVRFMDYIDRLAARLTSVLEEHPIEKCDFLSQAERFALSIRPIPYSLSDTSLQNLKRIIAKVERHDRELAATPIEEMLPLLASEASPFTVHPPRERAPKPPRAYPRPWEIDPERLAHIKVTPFVPPAPKSQPKQAETKEPRDKKGKRRQRAA